MNDVTARIALILRLSETVTVLAGRAIVDAEALCEEALRLRERAARLRAESRALRLGPPQTVCSRGRLPDR